MTLSGMALDQIFLEVLNLSLAALPLMAAVLILRLVFRRAPRRVICLLWLAVWLRLLLPVHLEVPWGIASAQAIPEETALGVPVTPAGAASIAYELVGDTANGGLGLISVPTADPGGNVDGGGTFALHDEAWVDVTGSRHLFGSGEHIAEEIRQRIKDELGLTVSIGVSFNKVFA